MRNKAAVGISIPHRRSHKNERKESGKQSLQRCGRAATASLTSLEYTTAEREKARQQDTAAISSPQKNQQDKTQRQAKKRQIFNPSGPFTQHNEDVLLFLGDATSGHCKHCFSKSPLLSFELAGACLGSHSEDAPGDGNSHKHLQIRRVPWRSEHKDGRKEMDEPCCRGLELELGFAARESLLQMASLLLAQVELQQLQALQASALVAESSRCIYPPSLPHSPQQSCGIRQAAASSPVVP